MQYVQGSRSRLPFLFLRKLAIVLLIFVTLISSTFLPKADAIAPAIVAGGAVVTFVGVVAVASICMDVFGMEAESEKTMAVATGIWYQATDATKKMIMDSYNAALAAGSKTMVVSSDFKDWVIDGYAALFAGSAASAVKSDTLSTGERISYWTNYNNNGSRVVADVPSGYYYLFAGGYTASVDMMLFTPQQIANGYKSNVGAYAVSSALPAPRMPTIGSVSNAGWSKLMTGAQAAKMVLAGVAGGMVMVPTGTVNDVLAKKQAMRDAFPTAIPVPTPGDFIYTPMSTPGVDVYQKGDQLIDDAGKVYSPDQVQVKAAPIPRVATDAAGNPIKDAAGNPVLGVPVGAVSGNPAIPGTIVNIKTGEAVQTGTDTANPPFDTTIGTINWGPITGLPAAFTTTFPFSLPWDVKRLIDLLVASPQQPKIQAKFYGEDMIITLPRLVTDNILLIRSGILISVVLGLVLLTRKLLGGAQ